MPRTAYTWGSRTVRSNRYAWGQIHKAVTLYLGERHGPDEIAEAAGMTRSGLYRVLRALGLTRPKPVAGRIARSLRRGEDYGALKAEVVRLHGRRVPGCEIAETLRLSESTVSTYIREAGRTPFSRGFRRAA